MKDLSQLQKLNDFVDDAAFIRDVSKVKQVERKEPFCCSGVVVFCFVLFFYSSEPNHLISRCRRRHLLICRSLQAECCLSVLQHSHFCTSDLILQLPVLFWGFFKSYDVFSHRTTK